MSAAVAAIGLLQASCSQEPVPASAETGTGEAPASVLALVEECDVLAAHPDDPQRMAEGVDDDRIVPRLAVAACEDAARRKPDEPRLTFQLGRALLAKDDKEKALKLFQDAAKQGHAAAYGYLGDAYQFGSGVKADVAQARAQYAEAVSRGFTKAQAQIEMLTFDPANYSVPAVGMLYAGQLDALRGNADGQLRNYVFSFVTALGEECGPVLQPKSVLGFFRYRYPDTWKAEDDNAVRVAVMGSIAEHDAKRFLRRHGCEGPVVTQLTTNMNRLLQN